jgi:hypothetical protein
VRQHEDPKSAEELMSANRGLKSSSVAARDLLERRISLLVVHPTL